MNYCKQLAVSALVAYAGLEAARAVVRFHRRFSFRNRVVLVTGGSRGLGLVLARELVREGARVAICSSNIDSVERAVEDLRAYSSNGQVMGLRCDVRSDEDVFDTVMRVQRVWGEIEVLFNVAGIIEVGPVDAMQMTDFENAMNVNCWGALRTTQCVLPGMRRIGWGRIVNVASLGGKQAVPHMLPYVVSKFALVGMSKGLRAELKKDNIFVTAACPGLMRTGSPRNATFKGRNHAEYAWFAVGDSLPVVSMSAEKAASQIMAACQAGRGEVLITNCANLSSYLQGMFPELTREMLELVNQFLPDMGGLGHGAAKGSQSESAITQSFLTRLSQQAALKNNQIPNS